MYIKANLSRDVARTESFLSTDIASLGLWNSNGMAWVSSSDIYFKEFNRFFDGGLDKAKDNLIAVNTGGDGDFKVVINLNQDLSEEDKKILYKSEKGISLQVDGLVGIGSPEWIGYNEQGAIKDNMVDMLEVPSGKYIVDAHSLITRKPTSEPQYIIFVFCLFTEEKYKKYNTLTKSISKVVSLKYLQTPA